MSYYGVNDQGKYYVDDDGNMHFLNEDGKSYFHDGKLVTIRDNDAGAGKDELERCLTD